jgi:2-dehydro-3-deoxyglucarate aldolase/4-hydroxy-2-oxoheptanedioate aldolase
MTSKRTAAKRPEIAFWLETASQAACEIAALVGYRIVLLDMEHGVLSLEAADRLIPFCRGLGLVVYPRVAAAARVPIQHALDAGADGVILPQIRDARHAREVAAFAKYPPLGSRGIGYSRTMDYAATPAGFVDAENRRTRCYAMIETTGGLAEVEAIAALATVDGLFIGPSDLSLARGRGTYRATPADVADARRVADAAAAVRKPWAMPAPDPRVLAFATRHGARFVTVSDDLTALRVGFAHGLAPVKGK